MKAWFRGIAVALASAVASATPVVAEEGMWTFDHFPATRMQSEMGWAPDQAWLDRVMVGTARMPGCSASSVSAEGLVLTNHHCVMACALALSSADHNYVDQGFIARSRSEEQRCAGMYVQVLTHVEDVTARISAATDGVAPAGFAHARDAEIARIEQQCGRPGQRCEVVTLYQGGRYALYAYRRFDDVRLVFAPEYEIAAFGGEADNFSFPRFDLDCAFLRLYENGAPVETPAHLSLRFTPLTADEIVMVSGNPGGTSRLETVAELTFQRDYMLPWRLRTFTAQRDRLKAYAQRGQDQARVASSALQSVENSLKVFQGRRQALLNTANFTRMQAAEADLQARVHRNLAAQREIGDAWTEIATAERSYRTFYVAHQQLEASAAPQSDLFAWARDLVRAAAERAKPNEARLPRYTEARLPLVQRNLNADRAIDRGFEEANLAVWLTSLRSDLTPANALSQKVLGGQTPDALAHNLAQSTLADPAVRQQLWQGGAAAIAASNDPMIMFVRRWDSDARLLAARYNTLVDTPIALGRERIAQARFRAFGEARYPDATFSPRLSYGRVRGWTEAGDAVAPFTQISGLYARASAQAPFQLPPSWSAAQPRLDGATIFNVATSNDIIGGNSGSPLLDRDGRIVGVVFDGNTHALGGDYFYDGDSNRAVSVASTAIRAALRDVYGMNDLLAELSR